MTLDITETAVRNERMFLLESIAHALAKASRYESTRSIAAMIARDLANDLRNGLSDTDVNEFFSLFEQAKQRERAI